MYNSNKPSIDELPTSANLIRSTAVAIAAAAAILVTTVLPSEYGIDPTGVGRILGLTEMGEIKMQLAEEAEADRRMAIKAETTPGVADTAQVAAQPPAGRPVAPKTESDEQLRSIEQVITNSAAETSVEPALATEPGIRSDEITITLSPGQGTEVKLVMEAGAKARFEWTANGGVLNYDTHGDGGGQAVSYEKGRGVPADEGVLEAAFDGNHGWFWRNRTEQNVTMTLRTSGAYRELKRML